MCAGRDENFAGQVPAFLASVELVFEVDCRCALRYSGLTKYNMRRDTHRFCEQFDELHHS